MGSYNDFYRLYAGLNIAFYVALLIIAYCEARRERVYHLNVPRANTSTTGSTGVI